MNGSSVSNATLLFILPIDVQLPLIESLSGRRFSGLVELGPPRHKAIFLAFFASLRDSFPQSAASHPLFAFFASLRDSFPQSAASHPLFAFFAPLRDSFPPVSSFSRQGNFRIVTVIIILIPSLRSLRLCEILFPQSVRSLAKTLRSPREFPRSRSHRHPCPSVSSVVNLPPHTLLVATLLLEVLLWLFPILPPGPIRPVKPSHYR